MQQKKRIPIIFFLLLTAGGTLFAQSREVLTAYQNQLQPLFEKVYTAPTDNERYNANEQAVQLFNEALDQDGSFAFAWDFGKKVSVLTSSDRQFRVITWPVVRDNGEYECFGFVQAYNEKTESYDIYTLHDKSDEVITAEESVLTPDTWFGCVYQELVEDRYEGRTFYTLIGWTGVDNLSQRKVIEPVCFRSGSSKPQFGQNLFRREKNLRRVVLQYAKEAMVNVHFDEQYCEVTENKKTKRNGRVVNVQQSHNEKFKMIIFDEVAPPIPSLEGLYHYYVPTGTEMAYIFVNGRWEKHDGAQGRVANEKLNKEFVPVPKSAPAYRVNFGEAE